MRRNKDGPTKKDPKSSKGVSRRGFLSSVGAGAASVAAASQLSAESGAKANIVRVDEKVSVTLSINGRSYQQLVEPRWSLAYVLPAPKLGANGASVVRAPCFWTTFHATPA